MFACAPASTSSHHHGCFLPLLPTNANTSNTTWQHGGARSLAPRGAHRVPSEQLQVVWCKSEGLLVPVRRRLEIAFLRFYLSLRAHHSPHAPYLPQNKQQRCANKNQNLQTRGLGSRHASAPPPSHGALLDVFSARASLGCTEAAVGCINSTNSEHVCDG